MELTFDKRLTVNDDDINKLVTKIVHHDNLVGIRVEHDVEMKRWFIHGKFDYNGCQVRAIMILPYLRKRC